jgi:uncharacterized delta-60 repeat protein
MRRGAAATLVAFCALCGVAVPGVAAAPGDLDPSFGVGGKVVLPFGDEPFGRGVAIQPDGRIVVAGSGGDPARFTVSRLLPDGAPDPSFGAGGTVTTAIDEFAEARSVAVQPDGKIVAVGSAKGAVNGDFAFVRYGADGTPDPGFGGGDGIVVLPVGADHDEANAVSIGADGRIYATGRSVLPADQGAGTAVLMPGGEPDASFSEDGTVVVQTPVKNDQGKAVVALPDGRVLLASESGAGVGAGFVIVRLLPGGGFDPSFTGGGIVVTPIPGENVGMGLGRSTDLIQLSDGRFVVSGYGYDYVGVPAEYDSKFALARYLPEGELDPGFGFGGIAEAQIASGDDSAEALGLLPDGRVALGGIYRPTKTSFAPALARFVTIGDLDPTFGAGGVVTRPLVPPIQSEDVRDLAIDAFGRIVTVGVASEPGDARNVVVARYGDPQPTANGPVGNRPPRSRMKKVPRRVSADELKGFSGTASDPDGNALRRVQIALVRLVDGAKASRRREPACLSLRSRKPKFKRAKPRSGGCAQRWLTVKGKARWRFRLRGLVPPGRYVVYSRAIDSEGLAESSFSRRAGNRYAFRVR